MIENVIDKWFACGMQVKALRSEIASISEQSGAERLKLLDARHEADRLSSLIIEVCSWPAHHGPALLWLILAMW